MQGNKGNKSKKLVMLCSACSEKGICGGNLYAHMEIC